MRPMRRPGRSPRWSGTRRMRRLERPRGGEADTRAPIGTERPPGGEADTRAPVSTASVTGSGPQTARLVGIAPPGPDGQPVPGTWLPSVPGILTAEQILATGRSIAAVQQRDGAIGWPDGHVDAWNHVECAMALSVCGLRGPARRAYAWLRTAQRPEGSWPKRAEGGAVIDDAVESNHAAYPAVGVWHELLVTGDDAFAARM